LTRSWLIVTSLFLFSTNLSVASEVRESDFLFKEATDAVKVKSYLKAINIFEQLANDAEADAQYNLALLLKSGKGKPQDYKAALKWAWLALLGDIDEAEKLVDQVINEFGNIDHLVDYFEEFNNNLSKKTLNSFIKSVINP